MSSRISKQVMELVDELADWFGEEMLRLEEKDMYGEVFGTGLLTMLLNFLKWLVQELKDI